jgi:hypothetical protein
LEETHLSVRETDEILHEFNITDGEVSKAIYKIITKAKLPRRFVIADHSGKSYTIFAGTGRLKDENGKPVKLFKPRHEDDSVSGRSVTVGDGEAKPSTPFPEPKPTPKPQKGKEKEKPSEKTMAEAASTLGAKCRSIEAFIRSTYASEILGEKLLEKEIQALVYVLARVDAETSTYPTTRTPSRLYDWATVRSSITLPFLNLSQAANEAKFDKEFDLKAGWGFTDDNVVLPSKESIDDDETYWGKIGDLLHVMGIDHTYSASKGETVPDISSTTLARNNYFGNVYLRLVELVKSPGSATLRSGKITALEEVKNHVDYMVLLHLYQKDKERYKNLPLSPIVQSCQRTVKVTRNSIGAKNKIETTLTDSHVGCLLSERLLIYVEKQIGKTPESEPFFRFIGEIIKRIALKVSDDYTLPKSFFASPNIVIRRQLRRGPEIKSKGTTKPGNTYVPFSFAKSAECSDMPEAIRKTLTSAGSNVSQYVDSINSFTLDEQNEVIPSTLKYVSLCYSLSDDLRKAWQKNAEVLSELDQFTSFFETNPLTLDEEDRDRYLAVMSRKVHNTRPVHSDETKQAVLKKNVLEAVDSRKRSRKGQTSSK